MLFGAKHHEVALSERKQDEAGEPKGKPRNQIRVDNDRNVARIRIKWLPKLDQFSLSGTIDYEPEIQNSLALKDCYLDHHHLYLLHSPPQKYPDKEQFTIFKSPKLLIKLTNEMNLFMKAYVHEQN